MAQVWQVAGQLDNAALLVIIRYWDMCLYHLDSHPCISDSIAAPLNLYLDTKTFG